MNQRLHTSKVLVRVMCSFDVEVEVNGQDVALAELGADAKKTVVAAVQKADFEGASLVAGVTPIATVRRVHATLELYE